MNGPPPCTRGSDPSRRENRCALIELGQVSDLAQVADAARMDDGRANVVDELLANELFAIVNRGEHLATAESASSYGANQAKAVL